MKRAGRGALAVLWIAAVLAGCGGPRYRLPEGCTTGDAVPSELRRDVESAARTLLERARAGRWKAIWNDAASLVRQRSTSRKFLDPLVRMRRNEGILPDAATRELAVVRFGKAFPRTSRVGCTNADGDSLVLFLPDHPLQASLVQEASQGKERFYLATLWFLEKGRWRLDAFFAKPATAYGKDWKEYEAMAQEERLKQHSRNAALLYNLAIDLSVPASWIKPPAVERLQKQQRRLMVEHLPAGRLDLWAAPPDTFRVFRMQYSLRPEGLGVIVTYDSAGPIDDTAFQEAYGDRLYRYFVREFPEYADVFTNVTLEASDRADRKRTWFHVYPLGERP